MKNVFLATALVVFGFLDSNGQSFRVRGDNAIQVGYRSYKYLTFGVESSPHNNGQWAIEHWEGGFNFWKPWPSSNYGNYKLFIKDDGNVGIGHVPSYKLDVHGDIVARGRFRVSSDKRLKKEIKPLYGSLDKLLKLNGVSYKKILPPKEYQKGKLLAGIDDVVKQKTILGDTASTKSDEELEKNFGFVAQELEEIFPELVDQDEDGYLNVDYVSLVPVLVEALKEIQLEVDTLRALNAKVLASKSGGSSFVPTSKSHVLSETLSEAKLYQNNPNPFNVDTEIKYYLPQEVDKAFIGIYDLNGKQLRLVEVNDRGYSSQLISGSELHPGIYIYVLIADGQRIDSKQMILMD